MCVIVALKADNQKSMKARKHYVTEYLSQNMKT